jgi:hypothetical protein
MHTNSIKSSLISVFEMLLGQSAIVCLLYFMCNWITFFTFPFAGYVVSGLITFSLYALIWSLIWWTLYVENGITQFFLKLTFATFPLIGFTACYILLHPTPNYQMMIPLLPSEIHFYFATAVTGTLLFPWYSIALIRFFSKEHKWLRFLWITSSLAIGGVISFTLCFNLLPAQW